MGHLELCSHILLGAEVTQVTTLWGPSKEKNGEVAHGDISVYQNPLLFSQPVSFQNPFFSFFKCIFQLQWTYVVSWWLDIYVTYRVIALRSPVPVWRRASYDNVTDFTPCATLHPRDSCYNRQFVFLIHFNFFIQISNPPPTWQSSIGSMCIWVCFCFVCPFTFFRSHIQVKSCSVCLSLSDLFQWA